MRRDREFWTTEAEYCEDALANGPGRNFNFDLEVFLTYVTMQRNSAYGDGDTIASERINKVVAKVLHAISERARRGIMEG